MLSVAILRCRLRGVSGYVSQHQRRVLRACWSRYFLPAFRYVEAADMRQPQYSGGGDCCCRFRDPYRRAPCNDHMGIPTGGCSRHQLLRGQPSHDTDYEIRPVDWLREIVVPDEGESRLRVHYVESILQAADVFTKAFTDTSKWKRARVLAGIVDVHECWVYPSPVSDIMRPPPAAPQAEPEVAAPSIRAAQDDVWIHRGGTWIRLHLTPRDTLYAPTVSGEGPCLDDLGSGRITKVVSRDGSSYTLVDDWSDTGCDTAFGLSAWTGSIIFSVVACPSVPLGLTHTPAGADVGTGCVVRPGDTFTSPPEDYSAILFLLRSIEWPPQARYNIAGLGTCIGSTYDLGQAR